MGWKVILDAIRFILAKYEPVARHGDLFQCIFEYFLEKAVWGTTLHYLRVPSEFGHFLTY